MAMIFLIPATGFYYTKHSCAKTGEVQMVMDTDYSCCAENTNKQCEIESSDANDCCPAETPEIPLYTDIDENCCSNEGQYIKTEDIYSPPARVEAPQTEYQYTIAANLLIHFQKGYSVMLENTRPPPAYTSKNILLLKSVLLI